MPNAFGRDTVWFRCRAMCLFTCATAPSICYQIIRGNDCVCICLLFQICISHICAEFRRYCCRSLYMYIADIQICVALAPDTVLVGTVGSCLTSGVVCVLFGSGARRQPHLAVRARHPRLAHERRRRPQPQGQCSPASRSLASSSSSCTFLG